MANKIRTEADRKATPQPAPPKGVTITTRLGQKSSLEPVSYTHLGEVPT